MDTYLNQNKTTTTLPVIRNLEEASRLNPQYDAIITAGPQAKEVNWGHPNHFIRSFADVTYENKWYTPPTIQDVEDLMDFASTAEGSILIHCHAGMSRSTATAIGVSLLRGWNAEESVPALIAAHPQGRPFIPNQLMVSHLETIFGFDGLADYVESLAHEGSGW
jgi:predicted protein tyrosine phosphatase